MRHIAEVGGLMSASVYGVQCYPLPTTALFDIVQEKNAPGVHRGRRPLPLF
jgi:hypothetical protein